MDERKRQLEEKKQKLAALKEKKRAAEEAKKEKLLAHMEKRGERPSATGATGSTSAKEEEVADILLGVGVDPSPQKLPAPEKDSRDASPAPTMRFSASRPTTLSVSQNVQVNIAPKETVAYSKTTQTVGEEGGGLRSGLSIGGTPSHDYEWEEDGFGDGGLKMGGSRKHARAGTMDEGSEVESDLSPTAHVPPELAGLVSSIIRSAEGGTVVGEETKEESPVEEKRLELSEEEKAKIMAEASFQDYFAQAIGLLDRAAANPYDKYVFREIMPDAGAKVDSGAKISLAHSFTHPLAEKKYVMGLEFSETHPELVAVAYGDEGDDFISHHGSHILVWNVKLPNKATPEHIFHSTSKVTSVAWSKFHPHLLIGGTYSGQICVWDRRQAKKTPAQRSPLSANAHTHPVYGLKVVGTQNANNLVSLSKDGRLCTWSLDMVAQPLQVIDLTAKQSRQIGGQCLDFPAQDVNNFLVGSEEGGVYQGCRHGQKPGVTETFENHSFLVSGIRCHRAQGPVDFSHLFLTSSFDWSIRLYSAKETKPLFAAEDHRAFLLDVRWSPVHPALFANADVSGLVEVWDLNADTELPAASIYAEGRVAVPKLQWSPNGNQLVVGTAKGAVHVYDIHESLAQPGADAWGLFSRTLMDLKTSQEESAELGEAFAASARS